MYAIYYSMVPLQSEIILRLPLMFLLSPVFLYRSYYLDSAAQLSPCIYMCIYIFLSSSPYPFSRAVHRASSSLLYSFTVSRLVRPPLFSLPLSAVVHAAALRGERPGCLFVRFTLDHSYFLSRLSAATPSSVASTARSAARVSPSHPPPPSVRPVHASLSVSSVPFASFSNLRRQCCKAGYAQLARRAGARNTRRGHVDSLRSLARLASLCFASLVALLRRARRGAERSVSSSSSSSLSLDATASLLIVRAAASRVRTCADVIFRLVKSRNNRASGAYVWVCGCVRIYVRADVRVHARAL